MIRTIRERGLHDACKKVIHITNNTIKRTEPPPLIIKPVYKLHPLFLIKAKSDG